MLSEPIMRFNYGLWSADFLEFSASKDKTILLSTSPQRVICGNSAGYTVTISLRGSIVHYHYRFNF